MSTTIRVFDPAMCCSTGVCGPGVDPELARFASDVDWLQKQGVKVEGVRTWRTTPRGFEINDVTEQPSPLAALMPPIVRKILATP